MRLLLPKNIVAAFIFFISIFINISDAKSLNLEFKDRVDRIHLVSQQIHLIQDRLVQSQRELTVLQQSQASQIPALSVEKASKNLLDKALLDISVSKSNTESINIELADAQQTIVWLEKSIQEIENQLNVMNIFGLKVVSSEMPNTETLRKDILYQQKLLGLERSRLTFLKNLENILNTILSLRKDNYNHLKAVLQSRHLLHLKQAQVADELYYQKQQSFWLRQLNAYNEQLLKIDPVKSREEYIATERNIYHANEKANYVYIKALISRYTDQIQQMKLAVIRNQSISVLTEMSDQYQTLNKQLDKLDDITNGKITTLENHLSHLSLYKKDNLALQTYLDNLSLIVSDYKSTVNEISRIKKILYDFRFSLDHELQAELSSRQGFPTIGLKTFLDIGKEMLLVPALTFQSIKSLSNSLVKGFESTRFLAWSFFAFAEIICLSVFYFIYKFVLRLLNRPSQWRDKINTKWLSLQWLHRNLLDLFIITNIVSMMAFFRVARQHYIFIVYLSIVWLVFKSIMMTARLCLVETTHDTAGHDMRLYHRLKWIVSIGTIITAFTVFVHQLPLIYELKALCDRLFLLQLMMVSVLLLRSYDVVPNLILSHMENNHPYLRKSIRLIGILVPILLFGNSVIGLFGYLNLIMTVSWYEGLFLMVLIVYLILRGLLSDAMEQASRLMIQYANNGWLWTEAFLKPIDKILRISLFLSAWTVLFILYGWDKQSPIVERLTRLLNHKLVSLLGTVITPVSVIELCILVSVFFWIAKWTREFVYRLLLSRTKDMGLRNSIAILSQYTVIVIGIFICMRVLSINPQALAAVAAAFAFGVGLGLRDLANNFACGFLILLERPLRVGDIVEINGIEGDVTHIGSRAVTVRTWDCMELVVPNAEIFNKSFTNWTAKDSTVRSVILIKISRYDNPHEVKKIIQNVVMNHTEVLKDPIPEVFLKDMSDTLMDFEVRYYVNIRQVKSRMKVISNVLMEIWDEFKLHGIKPPYPQQEILLKNEVATVDSFPRVVGRVD